MDRYSWDVTEDEEAWRTHQKRRKAEEYADDQCERLGSLPAVDVAAIDAGLRLVLDL